MNDLRDHRTETAPPDQAARDAALDPRRSVIVQAPAGSGKTGLLVQRFLGLLAEVSQPEEIVAITFTRKAAAEMRERILSAMHAARETSELPTSMNAQRTHALASKALEANARHGWSLLENPARLRVTTIDAFNTMLARQLPVRSGFGQSPAIAEQAGELYRTAARRLLAGMDRNDDAGEALRILLGHLDNRPGDLAELLSGMLAKRDLWQRHLEFGGLDREALEAALASEVENVLRVLHAEFPAHLHLAIPDIAKRCAAYLERRVDDVHWLQEIAAWTESPGVAAEDLPRWQVLARLLLTGTGGLRKP
ncbi:MAG: UvrD-helicase domain-containing protein, partial [Proteobacteria bacterium]|nr:UvrD-helicase domain-containing protein [Pseudomonadota bacterium]